MSGIKIFLTIVQVVSATALVGIVLFQSGKNAGLSGAIAGVADSFMTKNKAKTMDAKLAKLTKWVAAVFIVLTLVLNII